MSQTLVALEQRRSVIPGRIPEVGDFRSGSITAIGGRSGKSGCRCHKPGERGHGPNYRLTRQVNGKTTSESFATPAALRKAEREIAAFHRLRELSRELLEVNESICRARPVEDSLPPQEKKTDVIRRESARETGALLEVVFGGLRRSGHFDLEAVEMAIRAAAQQPGAKMLEQLLRAPAEFALDIDCPCGQRARFHRIRPRHLATVLGAITIERPYYLCPACHRGHSPRDIELDTEGTGYAPGHWRRYCTTGGAPGIKEVLRLKYEFDRGRI